MLHVLWYLIVLLVSLQMMWTWMLVNQGADNVRTRLEWLVIDKPLTLLPDREELLRWVQQPREPNQGNQDLGLKSGFEPRVSSTGPAGSCINRD